MATDDSAQHGRADLGTQYVCHIALGVAVVLTVLTLGVFLGIQMAPEDRPRFLVMLDAAWKLHVTHRSEVWWTRWWGAMAGFHLPIVNDADTMYLATLAMAAGAGIAGNLSRRNQFLARVWERMPQHPGVQYGEHPPAPGQVQGALPYPYPYHMYQGMLQV